MRNLGLFDSPSSKIKISTKIYDHKLFGSTHSKVFIIDGQVGMITGANILEGHFRESKWFDQAVWAHSQNLWLYVRNNIFKPLWEKGSLVNNVEQILPLNLNSIEDRKHLSIPCLPKNRALAKIALFASKRNKLNLTNTLNKNRSKGILSSIENARNNIKIFSPNFNADHPVSAIKKLLIKGVNVKIMVNSSKHKNTRKPIFEGKNSKEIYKELLKFIKQKKPSGRLEFKYFSRDGNTAALKSLENTSHSKFMAIDNKAIRLGSSNM